MSPGSVTRTNLWSVHMGNCSPVDQTLIKLIRIFLKWKYIQDKSYAILADIFFFIFFF